MKAYLDIYWVLLLSELNLIAEELFTNLLADVFFFLFVDITGLLEITESRHSAKLTCQKLNVWGLL